MKNYLSLNAFKHMEPRGIKIMGPVSEFNPITEEEEVSFALYNLWPQHRAVIQQALSKVDGFNEVFFIEKGKNNEILHFFVPRDYIDEFYNRSLPQFKEAISNSIDGKAMRGGQRKVPGYKNLEIIPDRIRQRIDGTPLQQDVETANEKILDNWEQVLQQVNDPKVRKQLLMYQMTDSFAANYGWRLSRANIAAILTQKPDATFVTSREMWETKFKHSINPGAQRIIITQPTITKDASLDDLNAAAAKRGFKDYKTAMKDTHGSRQTQMGIDLAAKQKGAHGYTDIIVYDVSETTPMNKEHDIWATQMGLIDNLRALPNAPLAAELKKQGKDDKEIRQSNLTEKQLEAFRKKITALCRKVCPPEASSDLKYTDDESAIEQMVFEIGKVYAGQNNLLSDKTKNSYAARLCCIVAANVGFKVPYVSLFIGNHKMEKKDMAMVYQAYIDIMKCINDTSIQESTGIIPTLSFSQFMEKMKSLGGEIMSDKEAESLNELKRKFKKLCQ